MKKWLPASGRLSGEVEVVIRKEQEKRQLITVGGPHIKKRIRATSDEWEEENISVDWGRGSVM